MWMSVRVQFLGNQSIVRTRKSSSVTNQDIDVTSASFMNGV